MEQPAEANDAFGTECYLDDIIDDLETGDLLLWEPDSVIGRAISAITGKPCSHAGKLLWVLGRPMVCEVRELIGGRVVTLEGQIAEAPGKIRVYKVNKERYPEYDAEGALRFMLQYAGQSYGYLGILKIWLHYMPLARIRFRLNSDDAYIDDMPVFCSQAVSCADRQGGGVDPVKECADNSTDPGDLARSLLYTYFCTIKGITNYE